MLQNRICPYIRLAMFSTIRAPFRINDRALFDYEIILVSGGACTITIDGTPYQCRNNDVVLIPPGVHHRFDSLDGLDFIQPHIHFDLVYSDKSAITPISYKPVRDMSEEEKALIQENAFLNKHIPYVFTPCDIESFRELFFRIIRIFNDRPANFELLYKMDMIRLIHEILSQFEVRLPSAEMSAQDPAIAVKSYIDNNYTQIITLENLQTHFYCNKFTLMRSFKRLYRCNIITYYRNKRIEYAKKLLSESSVTIRQIGEALGFTDAYSFSRFFKLYTGISPREYRNKTTK